MTRFVSSFTKPLNLLLTFPTLSLLKPQMIEEVMLDRWLLEQIDTEYDLIELSEENFVLREQLSQEVLDLLS